MTVTLGMDAHGTFGRGPWYPSWWKRFAYPRLSITGA